MNHAGAGLKGKARPCSASLGPPAGAFCYISPIPLDIPHSCGYTDRVLISTEVTEMSNTTYEVTIETNSGERKDHGYSLGTDLALARKLAEASKIVRRMVTQ